MKIMNVKRSRRYKFTKENLIKALSPKLFTNLHLVRINIIDGNEVIKYDWKSSKYTLKGNYHTFNNSECGNVDLDILINELMKRRVISIRETTIGISNTAQRIACNVYIQSN